MILPNLRNYITVPDYYPHCEVCGDRGMMIGDFTHTNYKGAIYDCYSGDVIQRFIDREDDYFSINYRNMSEKDRRIYLDLNEKRMRVFLKMVDQGKKYLKMKKKERKIYMNDMVEAFYF